MCELESDLEIKNDQYFQAPHPGFPVQLISYELKSKLLLFLDPNMTSSVLCHL